MFRSCYDIFLVVVGCSCVYLANTALGSYIRDSFATSDTQTQVPAHQKTQRASQSPPKAKSGSFVPGYAVLQVYHRIFRRFLLQGIGDQRFWCSGFAFVRCGISKGKQCCHLDATSQSLKLVTRSTFSSEISVQRRLQQ